MRWFVVAMFVARSAAADPAPADVPPVPVGPSALDDRAAHDAAADRAVGFSTAINLAPGNVDITLRSVLNHGGMLSAAIGVTRNVELSVQAIRVGTVGVGFGAGGKVVLRRGATWAFAVDGNITVGDNHYMTADALLSGCVDTNCFGLFTASVGIASIEEHGARLFDGVDQMSGPQLTGDMSIVMGTSWARPLLEAAYFGSALGFAGVRFTNRHVAFDVGVGAIHRDSADSTDAGAVVALGVRL